ncbi:MAG: hypothetical protein H0U23_11420 [Blastocatellia bacterium]|nr:hypothetical protein [Blastocatellia bacterium]
MIGRGNFSPVLNPTGNPAPAIKRLDTVASENREPDFFELLRATILDGSLGQNTAIPGSSTTGVTGTGATTVFPDVHMSNKTHHILSIGAAIIDQADPDSYPTRIQFRPVSTWWMAFGIESLPYITQLYPASGKSPTTSTLWTTYLLFQLWNPHLNTPVTPPTVRLRLDGSVGIFTGGNGQFFNSSTDTLVTTGGASITLVNANSFSTPTALTSANSTAAGNFAAVPAATGTYVGYRLPDYLLKSGAPNTPHLMLSFGANTAQRFNATMKVDVGGGVFVPYNHFIGINDPTSWIDGAEVDVRAASASTGNPATWTAAQMTQSPPSCFTKADPRATRFGIFQLDANQVSTKSRLDTSLWPSSTTYPSFPAGQPGYGGAVGATGPIQHAPLRFPSTYYPASLCLNTGGAGMTSYADPDAIVRPADARYPNPSATIAVTSTPYNILSGSGARDYWPIILNRPFRNVAELGYAFRELPWKTLDMFTDQSGDAGLLDVLSVADEPLIVAGRVSLNTRQSAVVQAILSAAGWDEITPATVVAASGSSATASGTMATNLVNNVAAKNPSAPVLNRSDLVSRANLLTAILPTNAGGNQAVKARREAISRAISSVVQTRTWNLMIDVIAQSGRYPPGTTDLTKFYVEGEQRYWVHVAIDRFTGKVVDRQIEVVKE